MIEFVQGDVFTEDAIAHGCNCIGVMGAGVAALVREKFPEAYEEYRDLCETKRFRLGVVHHWSNGDLHVFNLATQHDPGPFARLDAIEGAVASMITMADGAGVATIGMPRIGCGIGGLRWSEVRTVLQRTCERSKHVLVRVYEWGGR